MFLAFAVDSRDSVPFLIYFSVFATLGLFVTVHRFIQERTQYGLRHLFIAVTIAAVLCRLFRWFGMTMTVVLGTAASVAVLLLFGLEWFKSKTRSEEAANNG